MVHIQEGKVNALCILISSDNRLNMDMLKIITHIVDFLGVSSGWSYLQILEKLDISMGVMSISVC